MRGKRTDAEADGTVGGSYSVYKREDTEQNQRKVTSVERQNKLKLNVIST